MLKSALVAVDITNQYHAVGAKFPGQKIDFGRYMSRALGTEYSLFRGFAYGAQINDEATGFITALKHLGYEPRYFQAVNIGDCPNIAATDLTVPIVMDAWRASPKIDAIIVGSNDTRLIPLMERMKELGIKVVVFACDIPPQIREVADRCMSVDPRILTKGRNATPVPA